MKTKLFKIQIRLIILNMRNKNLYLVEVIYKYKKEIFSKNKLTNNRKKMKINRNLI